MKEIVQVHIYATDQSLKNLEVKLNKHLMLDKIVVVTKTDFILGRGYVSYIFTGSKKPRYFCLVFWL